MLRFSAMYFAAAPVTNRTAVDADRGPLAVMLSIYRGRCASEIDVRARGLERPARESWHGRAFFREGRGG